MSPRLGVNRAMATTHDPASRHLLVVDDDDRIRDLLKQFLTRAGFRVTTAAGRRHGSPAA